MRLLLGKPIELEMRSYKCVDSDLDGSEGASTVNYTQDQANCSSGAGPRNPKLGTGTTHQLSQKDGTDNAGLGYVADTVRNESDRWKHRLQTIREAVVQGRCSSQTDFFQLACICKEFRSHVRILEKPTGRVHTFDQRFKQALHSVGSSLHEADEDRLTDDQIEAIRSLVLESKNPHLSLYVFVDWKNPTAIRALTYGLLWRQFGLRMILPLRNLCPPLPRCLNYLYFMRAIVHASQIVQWVDLELFLGDVELRTRLSAWARALLASGQSVTSSRLDLTSLQDALPEAYEALWLSLTGMSGQSSQGQAQPRISKLAESRRRRALEEARRDPYFVFWSTLRRVAHLQRASSCIPDDVAVSLGSEPMKEESASYSVWEDFSCSLPIRICVCEEMSACQCGAHQSRTHSRCMKLLDVGTGANAIFGVLAVRLFGWSFVGTDIDSSSLRVASEQMQWNRLLDTAKVDLIHVLDDSLKLYGGICGVRVGVDNTTDETKQAQCRLFPTGDRTSFTISMCNPPFYDRTEFETETKKRGLDRTIGEVGQESSHVDNTSSVDCSLDDDMAPDVSSLPEHEAEADQAFGSSRGFSRRRATNATLAELTCEGGEEAFVLQMALESARAPFLTLWTTTMVGLKSTLHKLLEFLTDPELRSMAVLSMEPMLASHLSSILLEGECLPGHDDGDDCEPLTKRGSTTTSRSAALAKLGLNHVSYPLIRTFEFTQGNQTRWAIAWSWNPFLFVGVAKHTELWFKHLPPLKFNT